MTPRHFGISRISRRATVGGNQPPGSLSAETTRADRHEEIFGHRMPRLPSKSLHRSVPPFDRRGPVTQSLIDSPAMGMALFFVIMTALSLPFALYIVFFIQ